MKTIEEFLSHLYQLDVQLWLEGNRIRCNAPENILTDTLSHELRDRKTEIAEFLRQAEIATKGYSPQITPVPRDGNLPLSFAQQRLWFLEQLQSGGSTYNIPTGVRLTGSLNISVLEQSLNEIIRRHEVLRTQFPTVDGHPVVQIQDDVKICIPVIDLQTLDMMAQDEEVRSLFVQEASKPFDLATDILLRVKLLRLAEDEYVVLFTMHHIIFDGWSMEVLVRELGTIYTAFANNQPSPLPELEIQYGDFAAWQRQYLQGEILDKQIAYWCKQLGETLPVLQLPTDYPRGRVQTFAGGIESFTLPTDLSQGILSLAKETGVTPFIILLAAYKILLHRYTGQTDLLVGTPVANRHRREIEGLIGFFVNTLVLRSDLGNNPSFPELLQQVRETAYKAYNHQDIPFEKLVEVLQPERDLSFNPLFQVKFRLENIPTQQLDLPGLKLTPLQRTEASAKLDLSLDMYETSQGFVGAFEYNRGLFAAETIERMVEHFQTLLTAIVQNPEVKISELPLLTENEREKILFEWNQTQTNYSSLDYPDFEPEVGEGYKTFTQLFEAQVEKTPDAVALIFEDEYITYQELNHKSNQLAHYLIEGGVKPEVIVGLCCDRSPLMIIGVLGILKAGAAYLPLDPNYPQERLAFMLADSQVPILLTQFTPPLPSPYKGEGENHTSSFSPYKGEEESSFPPLQGGIKGGNSRGSYQIINLDTDWETIAKHLTENPNRQVTPTNLAYLIYTSGSTGVPKGVLIPHQGLTNLTEHKIHVCDVHPGDCVLQFFSLSFDASIPEIIMALGSGAKLCLAKSESLLPGAGLVKLLRDNKITHITITPSALSQLDSADLPDLRMILVGGEAPSPELVLKWSQGRRFINAYGPTEVTVNASMVLCGNGHPLLPTIRPSANKQLYVLDRYMQPVPIGVIGELYIGGVGIARGYLNRPDLTAEKFVPNPFYPTLTPSLSKGGNNISSLPPGQGGIKGGNLVYEMKVGEGYFPTLYKTGDLASYLPDGRIKLLGRIDNQVKIRGFRIEPQEVETLLCQHPDVRAGVVIVREDKPGEKRLVAYVVPDTSPPTSLIKERGEIKEKITTSELRGFIRDKLPEYLVPSAFVLLEALPLTNNGKLDMRSLPVPEQVNPTTEFIPPRTELESQLSNIYAQILNLEKVSIHDDFFDLGGHSLLATQLIVQTLQLFQIELTVIDLFDAPTVAGLAERIIQRQLSKPLSKSISQISDTEDEEREEIEI